MGAIEATEDIVFVFSDLILYLKGVLDKAVAIAADANGYSVEVAEQSVVIAPPPT